MQPLSGALAPGYNRVMDAAIYGLTGAYAGALAIWLIVRVINRRSIEPVCVAAFPVLVIMGFKERDEIVPILNRVLPESLLIGGTIALFGSLFADQQYINVMGRILDSKRIGRWGNRLFGPQFASQVNAEFKKRTVLTPTRIWTNVIGSAVLIAVGLMWMVFR